MKEALEGREGQFFVKMQISERIRPEGRYEIISRYSKHRIIGRRKSRMSAPTHCVLDIYTTLQTGVFEGFADRSSRVLLRTPDRFEWTELEEQAGPKDVSSVNSLAEADYQEPQDPRPYNQDEHNLTAIVNGDALLLWNGFHPHVCRAGLVGKTDQLPAAYSNVRIPDAKAMVFGVPSKFGMDHIESTEHLYRVLARRAAAPLIDGDKVADKLVDNWKIGNIDIGPGERMILDTLQRQMDEGVVNFFRCAIFEMFQVKEPENYGKPMELPISTGQLAEYGLKYSHRG